MNYIPHTKSQVNEMLQKIGVTSVEDLLKEFTPRFTGKLGLASPLSEMELVSHMLDIAKNNIVSKYFVGAGAYDHYSPAIINHIISRGEFLTAYTPYQPEVSQGMLQAIYEFQSYICLLTGMDIANASLYDGASALAEAMLLSSSYKKKKRIYIDDGLNPNYKQVLETYCEGADLEITGTIDDNTACVIVQNPDYYGNIKNLQPLADKAHNSDALLVTCVNEPTSLAILRPPGEQGTDIVVGEGQAFGIPISFGGPYLGFIAVKEFLLKKIPGRIVGMTTDHDGNKGFVLTLQAREQHIRRERATSNITTNQALLTLAATIYLACNGRNGLRDVAKLSYKRAHLLQEKLSSLGFVPANKEHFYNEFTVKLPQNLGNADSLLTKLQEKGIVGGTIVDDDTMLVCCTEKNSVDDIEEYVSVVKRK